MTKQEIYSKLLNFNSIDRIQLVRADYNGTNEGFNQQLTSIINELQSDYSFKYYSRLNDLSMMLVKAENDNDLNKINILESQIKSHEKTINDPFLVSLRKEIKEYINETNKNNQVQQNIFDLTIENLLKSGCSQKEVNLLFETTSDYNLQCNSGRFYVSKLENKFYTGIEYYRKVNLKKGNLSFPLNCPDLIPEFYNLALEEFLQKQKKSLGSLYNEINQTEKFVSNEVKRSKSVIENVTESFLSQSPNRFESKKALVNVYESYIYFLEQSKQLDIVKPETTKDDKDIEQYAKSFKQNLFNICTDKRNGNLYYGKVKANVLDQRNKELLTNIILKDRVDLLSNYNKRLYLIIGNVMQLFKAVNDYSNRGDNGLITKIKIREANVYSTLIEIKEVSKVIKHNVLNDEIVLAQKIKEYCILMLDDSIDLLNKRFGVDIYKSPLHTHFENVKEVFIKSINYDELKIINDIGKNKPQTSKAPEKPKAPEAPQQIENFKPDEVESSHPTHNPNDWNLDCFELFKYLFEEYYNDKKRTNTKLMCIWFYLSEYNLEKYNLKITKDNYKIFIKKYYGIAITNTDKPANYDKKVLGTLSDHRKIFEDSLK